jgi:hypothetical protein
MRMLKWLLVAGLYAGAVLADLTGHEYAAIAVAVVAVVATLGALEAGDDDDDDDELGLGDQRRALVLTYAAGAAGDDDGLGDERRALVLAYCRQDRHGAGTTAPAWRTA